jgi:Txe/YoeB family toxin of Txe-Axe toxin-antitoxin module
MSEELVIKKRAAAIKLAKELQPFEMNLGAEFLPVYMETLTEDLKQLGRDNRRLAKELDVIAKKLQGDLFSISIDGEGETITKLMRRYSTRITKSCEHRFR